ncbi:hypothetical protein DB354_00425 [Opitutus sp. ER46]|nr:hypothetical protein DB354_00425 [Opitutus sp. ER46]
MGALSAAAAPEASDVNAAAGNDLASILALTKTTAVAKSTAANYTPALKRTVADEEVDRLKALIAKTKAFRTNRAGDARSVEVRKIEIDALYRASRYGIEGAEQTAKELAAAFRKDNGVLTKDRFDIALLSDSIADHARAGQGKRGEFHERLGRALEKEFGGNDAVFGLYSSVMQAGESEVAVRVARKVLAGKAPAAAQGLAKSIMARDALVGTAAPLSLVTDENYALNLAAPTGTVTVVFFWDAGAGVAQIEALARKFAATPTTARWIYFGFGATKEQLVSVKQKVPYKGIHCTGPTGFGSEVAQAFKVRQLPYACIIDAGGKVAGYGDIQDIPTLIQRASR